ncbi:prolyl hydroxylase family protein [Thalassotalea montiporae]
MRLLECLEEKNAGYLQKKTVLAIANRDQQFSLEWFVHTVRSPALFEEQVLACAFALKWQLISLEQLASLFGDNAPESVDPKSVDDVLLDNSVSTESIDLNILYRTLGYVSAIVNWQGEKSCHDNIAATAISKLPESLFNNVRQQVTPQLKDVTLFGAQGAGSKDASIRNNSNFYTPLPNVSLELAIMERLTANMVGTDIRYAEPPVILRYLPGQYYHWHYDHIYPHNNNIQQQITQFGQRVTTGILNMNEDFAGGQTEFKVPQLSLSPITGQIIAFSNVDDNGERAVQSIHRGAPVESGEKWVMTLWFRDKPFWLRNCLLDG